MKRLLGLVLCLAIVGCGSNEATDNLSSNASAMIAGTQSPADLGFVINRFEQNAAVAFRYKFPGYTTWQGGCSGTLVGDRLVVAAGHCTLSNVDDWTAGAAPTLFDVANVKILVGADIGHPMCELHPESLNLHPDAKPSFWAIQHDVSVTILKESALETCAGVVPLRVNLDPMPDTMIGQNFLEGGYGSTDGSYHYSVIRYWGLIQLGSIQDDSLLFEDISKGFPSNGDSGSAVLLRGSDGALRAFGACSTGDTSEEAFSRFDAQGEFFTPFLKSDVVCGRHTETGTCMDGVVVACSTAGFSSMDCTADHKECKVDSTGKAVCGPCSCDVDQTCTKSCACDAQCPCSCDQTDGCDSGCSCDPTCAPDSGIGDATGALDGESDAADGPTGAEADVEVAASAVPSASDVGGECSSSRPKSGSTSWTWWLVAMCWVARRRSALSLRLRSE
jgi:hypothetical protein